MKRNYERLRELLTPILSDDGFGENVDYICKYYIPIFEGKMYIICPDNETFFFYDNEFELGYNFHAFLARNRCRKNIKMYVYDSLAFTFERYEIAWTFK